VRPTALLLVAACGQAAAPAPLTGNAAPPRREATPCPTPPDDYLRTAWSLTRFEFPQGETECLALNLRTGPHWLFLGHSGTEYSAPWIRHAALVTADGDRVWHLTKDQLDGTPLEETFVARHLEAVDGNGDGYDELVRSVAGDGTILMVGRITPTGLPRR
jgi:hypothetical protein